MVAKKLTSPAQCSHHSSHGRIATTTLRRCEARPPEDSTAPQLAPPTPWTTLNSGLHRRPRRTKAHHHTRPRQCPQPPEAADPRRHSPCRPRSGGRRRRPTPYRIWPALTTTPSTPRCHSTPPAIPHHQHNLPRHQGSPATDELPECRAARSSNTPPSRNAGPRRTPQRQGDMRPHRRRYLPGFAQRHRGEGREEAT